MTEYEENKTITDVRKQIASAMAILPRIIEAVGNIYKVMGIFVKRAKAIPPRLRYLAFRHGNPRVRKKNLRRVLEMMRGK